MRTVEDKRTNFLDNLFVSKISIELTEISEIIDINKSIYNSIFDDISPANNVGRKGLSAEQLFRIAILLKLRGLTYEELEFHLADSATFRSFARLFPGHYPKKSTLQENIKRISADTWSRINNIVVQYSIEKGIEKGDTIRIDATAVETNIHLPTDSSLMLDGIRVITRLLDKANDLFENKILQYSDHNRAAKKKNFVIENKKNKQEKKNLKYKEMLKISEKVIEYADSAIHVLNNYDFDDVFNSIQAQFLSRKIDLYADLLFRVIDQTKRRIFDDEKVPARQKIFSIFESHTDIISKENRINIFGHKIFISTGKSGIITDCIVVRGNPNDTTLFGEILERQKILLGKTPKKMAADGGFASKENLNKAKEEGVEDMGFSKKRGLKTLDMVRSEWIYEKLRKFRAGIEGIISALKRAFGLDRCTWTTWEGFNQYIQSSVVAFNLQVLARAKAKA